MSERQHDEGREGTTGTHQFPHVPGQDPRGSGLPRQRDAVPADDAGDDAATEGTTDATPDGGEAPDGGDAPLGGTKTTEEQLTADTEVERDALKSLDPDDTPA